MTSIILSILERERSKVRDFVCVQIVKTLWGKFICDIGLYKMNWSEKFSLFTPWNVFFFFYFLGSFLLIRCDIDGVVIRDVGLQRAWSLHVFTRFRFQLAAVDLDAARRDEARRAEARAASQRDEVLPEQTTTHSFTWAGEQNKKITRRTFSVRGSVSFTRTFTWWCHYFYPTGPDLPSCDEERLRWHTCRWSTARLPPGDGEQNDEFTGL